MPALALLGCVSAYRPPLETEPHAVVKFRSTYAQSKGPLLAEIVNIDDNRLLSYDDRPRETSTTSATRVHPKPQVITVVSEFYHVEHRMVTEQYTEYQSESYMESYNCGTGTSYRSCTRTATRQKPVTRWRNVWKNVRVVDADCSQHVGFAPMQGKMYLFQYSFRDHGSCDLRCYEQHPKAGGDFELSPCPQAPRAAD